MSTNPPDVDLQAAIAAAAGDPNATYDELLAMAADRLLRLTRKMLRNYPGLRRWEQTDDVFQTAALRLYRSLSEVRPESAQNFFGLAGTQIRRTLIDLARHHFGPMGCAGRHESGGDRFGTGGRDDPSVPGTCPATLEEWARFHEAIDALPDEVREVLSLQWYSGLDQRRVAEVLGISVPTVQRRWYQARHLLYGATRGERPSSD